MGPEIEAAESTQHKQHVSDVREIAPQCQPYGQTFAQPLPGLAFNLRLVL